MSETRLTQNNPTDSILQHFEADTSLTRNDFFLAPEPGNNFKYNNTLFTMMMKTCNGSCNLKTLGEYRYQRYQQSLADNGNFFFGPGSLLLYGAATFLYELMPSAESVCLAWIWAWLLA